MYAPFFFPRRQRERKKKEKQLWIIIRKRRRSAIWSCANAQIEDSLFFTTIYRYCLRNWRSSTKAARIYNLNFYILKSCSRIFSPLPSLLPPGCKPPPWKTVSLKTIFFLLLISSGWSWNAKEQCGCMVYQHKYNVGVKVYVLSIKGVWG